MDKTAINLDDGCRRRHSFTLTDPAAGEVIYVDCGAVVANLMLEKSLESGTHANNELASRHGAGIPTLALYDQGLYTKIRRDNRDHTD